MEGWLDRVVEVSLQIDRQDVSRAERRTATLKKRSVNTGTRHRRAMGNLDARKQAQIRQVEWKVGSDLSEGFLTFRYQ